MDAAYFGMPTIVNRNPDEISIANFTVLNGANALQRTADGVVGGGVVEHGALKGGQSILTNITQNTETGEYFISMDNQEDL